jgi:hypothetical protein
MCGGQSPPTPKAPPAPIPQAEATKDGLFSRQQAAAAAKNGGYESTMLSSTTGGAGGATASPTLGT